jgi:hypothetical protein
VCNTFLRLDTIKNSSKLLNKNGLVVVKVMGPLNILGDD